MRFSPTLALASALAAAFTTTKQPHVIVPGGARRKIFYLHFHKAGGTSFCTLFRDAGEARGAVQFFLAEHVHDFFRSAFGSIHPTTQPSLK